IGLESALSGRARSAGGGEDAERPVDVVLPGGRGADARTPGFGPAAAEEPSAARPLRGLSSRHRVRGDADLDVSGQHRAVGAGDGPGYGKARRPGRVVAAARGHGAARSLAQTPLRSRPLRLGVTVAVLAYDVVTGSQLQMSTLLGEPLIA